MGGSCMLSPETKVPRKTKAPSRGCRTRGANRDFRFPNYTDLGREIKRDLFIRSPHPEERRIDVGFTRYRFLKAQVGYSRLVCDASRRMATGHGLAAMVRDGAGIAR